VIGLVIVFVGGIIDYYIFVRFRRLLLSILDNRACANFLELRPKQLEKKMGDIAVMINNLV